MVNLNPLETLVAASLVLLAGRRIILRVPLLQRYTIPEPVVGGLLVAVLVFVLRIAAHVEVRFETVLQTPLMLAFFATIGLSVDLASLKAGGRSLALFLAVVVGQLIMQDALGIALAKTLGLDPLIGLLGGSITLSGGHGTGAAWGRVFAERHGIESATEVAIACATFGLILGGLVGGPVARFLISRHKLAGNATIQTENAVGFEQPKAVRLIYN